MSTLGRKVSEAMQVDGETVYIKSLNGGAIAVKIIEILTKLSKEPQLIAEAGALLVVACLCDEHGVRIYADDQVDYVREEASISFLAAFTEKALDFTGLADDADEVRKNLKASQ
jgi:hypothetical protein